MLSTAQKTAGGDAARGDLRNASRYPASAVPAITGLRISPHGVEATLVNISENGVLAECGERLKPGSAVTVVFEGTFVPRSMEGRVARNSVSSMGRDGRLRYHVGISFARPIDLGIAPEPEPQPAPTSAEPDPSTIAAAPDSQFAADSSPAPAEAGVTGADAGVVEIDVPLPVEDAVRNRW